MAIAADTWVETIAGRMRAYDIAPGMHVFGMDGMPVKVKSVQRYTPQEMYYVELSDGSFVEGDKFLTFPVRKFSQRVKTAQAKNPPKIYHRRTFIRKTVEELLAEGVRHPRHKTRHQYTIDTVAPLQYGYEDHAVPPFIAGMWFGCFNKKNRYKIPDNLKSFVRQNVQKSKQFHIVEKKAYWEIRPSIEATFLKDYATIPIREFPYKYLYGTPEQRIEFLSGFFSVRHKSLDRSTHTFLLRFKNDRYGLEMLKVICKSLGIRASIGKKSPSWYLYFATRIRILPDQPMPKQKFGERHRQIVAVGKCETRPCIHIETDKPLVVSDNFISICHLQANNKKS